MNDADRHRVAEIRDRCAPIWSARGSLGGLPAARSDIDFLLRLVDQQDTRVSELLATMLRLMDQQNDRVSGLLAANNLEVERRREAVAALRLLRQRFAGTVVDGQIPGAAGAAWVMDVDGKSVWVPEFIDAAIASAELPLAPKDRTL